MKLKSFIKNTIFGALFSAVVAGCSSGIYKPVEIWPSPREVEKKALVYHEYGNFVFNKNSTWEEVNEFSSPVSPKSLENITAYLEKIRYKGDLAKHLSVDYWQSAKETVESNTGDCEDFSILAAHFAEKFGYPPTIMALKANRAFKFHAVTLLKQEEDGKIKYGLIDKEMLIKPEFDCLEDLLFVYSMGFRHFSPREDEKGKYYDYFVYHLNPKHSNWREGFFPSGYGLFPNEKGRCYLTDAYTYMMKYQQRKTEEIEITLPVLMKTPSTVFDKTYDKKSISVALTGGIILSILALNKLRKKLINP